MCPTIFWDNTIQRDNSRRGHRKYYFLRPLPNTIQRDKTTKSENIYEMWAEYSWIQTVCPPDGTISLGNTCQKDKTTKHENIYNMQAE